MHFFNSSRPIGAYSYPAALSAAPFSMGASSTRHREGISGYILSHPYRSYMIALAVAITLSATNVWAADALPQVQQQGTISFISGGVGNAETEALKAVKDDYNLRITSAEKDGEYRGDTRIVISNKAGDILLDTVSAGPLFYTNLPTGHYVVDGYSEGQAKRKTVNVTKGTHARVHFSWDQNAEESETAPATQRSVEPTRISTKPIVVPAHP